ncbi:hypothetical protein [Actinospica sp.]|uniref:hypothetical protein n=1 Tax=Actinospica sp. TaxID=1872142 RepID=UPI002CB6C5A7|nr:hypothetical protein [Actinospica sp.]HWG28812.1 hypothetical protein [Actinospica sp.]
MNSTTTAVVIGVCFGLAGVLAGPVRISTRIRPRAFRGLAIAFGPILLWLACGGPIVPTMLPFCLATLALGEWRLRGQGPEQEPAE